MTNWHRDGTPARFQLVWWFAPETNYWQLNFLGLLLGVSGIGVMRWKARARTSLVGFGINAVAFLVGVWIAFNDWM